MLAFDVTVYRHPTADREDVVASWMTNPWGLKWLDQLVESGNAIQLTGNGYPTKFVVSAGVLLPIITKGLPKAKSPVVIGEDYFLPENWSGDIIWNRENALACTPGELLHVEAWDLS